MPRCQWCELDGRDGCPVHVRRRSDLVSVFALGSAVAFAVMVITLLAVAALR